VLAHDPEELSRRVREVVENPELRERMGDAAERRARTFTWDRPAETNLEVLRHEAGAGRPALGGVLAQSETAKAAARS
jgi:glycosyltransferase involved in cell wall biosynthesis